MLSENPAIGNKGRQPLRQPRRRVRDIQKFLRRHFSYEDYRIFMLRFYETGSSFRTIARHMGEKTSVVTRRAQEMMEYVRAKARFIDIRIRINEGVEE